MQSSAVLEPDGLLYNMEVHGAARKFFNGARQGEYIINEANVSQYRVASMLDKFTDTNHLVHRVYCLFCRCNMVTSIPPLTAKTLDDIKTKLASFTSQEYNETRYINTWDGGGNSKREFFEDAPTLQKETTLGSETVQLRYFWSFSSFESFDVNNPKPIYGNAIQSVKTWPLNVKEGIGECRRCPHELVASNTSTLCQECPSGKIAPEAASYCTSCPHNHTMVMDPLSRNNTKHKCVCMSGYEKKKNLKCKQCSVGFYSSFINSTCIASPPGGFIPHVGMTQYFRCQGNFISTTPWASFCVPCPWNTFSNHQNTICLPDKSLYEKIPSIYE